MVLVEFYEYNESGVNLTDTLEIFLLYQFLLVILTFSNTILILRSKKKRGNTSFFTMWNTDSLSHPQKVCLENDLCLELLLPKIVNGVNNLALRQL